MRMNLYKKNYKKIIISAPAKINLYLEILRKFDNDYHEIDSVMQSVDLSDILTISAHDTKISSLIIEIMCNNINIPINKNNLAYIAAEKFCKKYEIKDKHISINIDKNIPVAAGLAGGSTDAAAVFIGLNILFDLKIGKYELCELSKSIGADVPFCIMKGTMYTRGIGDIITSAPSLPECDILIVIGDTSSMSTKTAFETYDKLSLPKDAIKKDQIVKGLELGNLDLICANLYNTFINVTEEAILTINLIKKFNPIGTLMSGSGPAVFAIFNENDTNIDEAILHLEKIGYRTYKCKPCKSQDFYFIN